MQSRWWPEGGAAQASGGGGARRRRLERGATHIYGGEDAAAQAGLAWVRRQPERGAAQAGGGASHAGDGLACGRAHRQRWVCVATGRARRR
uniref:Uncharacterized protein n=1 Tax=Arundo donax TaxID=35708 RepID=A0A0A9HJ51_ARUDO